MTAQSSLGRSALASFVLATVVTTLDAQAPALLRELHRQLPHSSYFPLLGDLDGDGDLDVPAQFVGGVGALLNDGDGRFVANAPTGGASSGSGFSDAALADVDGDTDLDLVVIRGGSYSYDCYGLPHSLYLNDGAGHFADASLQLASFGNGADVEPADFDGDGDVDLLVGQYTNNYCDGPDSPAFNHLFVNDGTGSFSELIAPFSINEAYTERLALGDVDGDADQDVLICDMSATQLWRNDGALVFSDASAQLPIGSAIRGASLGDVDGDTDLDAVAWDYVAAKLWLNDGAGTFSVANGLTLTAHVYDARLVDLDLDGDCDWVANLPTSGSVFLNDGSGTFTDASNTHLPSSVGSSSRLPLGDVDGDADVDGLFPAPFGQEQMRLNDGSGHLFRPPVPTFGASLQLSGGLWQIGDVDGDGDSDLIGVGASGSASALRAIHGDGAGAFLLDTAVQPTFTGAAGALTLADLDGDGDNDAFVARWQPNGALASYDRLFLNGGSGVFVDASAQLPAVLDTTVDVVYGDVDGDLDLDLLIANVLINQPAPTRLYLNDGHASFLDAPPQAPVMPGVRVAQLGDIDGDGDLDAYLGKSSGHALFQNDGTGTFTPSSIPLASASSTPVCAQFGDLDSDGDLDLLVGNALDAAPPALNLFINQGLAGFQDASGQIAVPTPHSIARIELLDFDNDGDLDIFGSAGQKGLLINDGLAHFTDGQALIEGDITPVFALDFDRDADFDGLDWTGRLLTNTLRQVAWRQLPRPGRRLDLDVYGPANGHFILLGARDPISAVHTPFGELGVLRTSIFRIDTGSLDANGHASVRIDVPDNPLLVGRDYFWQALVGRPARLTNVERAEISGL